MDRQAPSAGKKILSITWYKVLPPKFGGQKGIALFNQYLSRLHPLICICSRNNNAPADISYTVVPELPVHKWQFLSPSSWKKITTLAEKENISHIILEHPYHGIAAVKAKKATGAMLILHAHNIEFQRFRMLRKWWWRLLRKYEKWVHQQADLVLFKTAEDRDYAIIHFGLNADKCIIVPYGVESRANISKMKMDEKVLLFAGTLDYPPNTKAVEAIYREIAPRLTAAGLTFKIVICGRNQYSSSAHLEMLFHPAVIVAGEVDDMSLYFSAADVVINPVAYGGGIQTKTIDALANNCPVVCFDHMIPEGLRAVAGNKLFSSPAGDWDLFVEQIIEAAEVKTKTPDLFFEKYGWEKIVADFNKYI